MNDRSDVDPMGKFGDSSHGLLAVERRALQVMAAFPFARFERTRSVFEFTISQRGTTELLKEAHGETIVLVVTADALEVRLPTTEWTHGAYGPAPSSVLWRRFLWQKLESADQIERAVERAFAARSRQFKKCRYCKRPFPPEHRHGSVCHGCAESVLGVAH